MFVLEAIETITIIPFLAIVMSLQLRPKASRRWAIRNSVCSAFARMPAVLTSPLLTMSSAAAGPCDSREPATTAVRPVKSEGTV